MTSRIAAAFFAASILVAGPALADQDIADQYPGSLLYSMPVEVIPNVWSAIGATAPPGYDNAGHNNNLSFIVTGDGVVVVNGGGCYGLAAALHDEIKKITDQPVKLIINENGQGHAMLGNSYWAEKGVPILAHVDAKTAFDDSARQSLDAAKARLKERADKTTIQGPTETFEDERIIDMGGMRIEVKHLGPAHSPGDIVVWLPAEKLVITGDHAFHERMLPVFDDTDTKGWIETWEGPFAALGALYVIPGHGHPTNMAQVERYTIGYLKYLRGKVGELIEAGGGLDQSYAIDQTPYAHLDTYEELHARNAGRVFAAMEFE